MTVWQSPADNSVMKMNMWSKFRKCY